MLLTADWASKHSRLRISQVCHDDLATLLDVLVLFREGSLDLKRCRLLLLSLLLICHHAFELLVGFTILRLQLRALDSETLPELLDLLDGVLELVKTDVEMALLLLELLALLVV